MTTLHSTTTFSLDPTPQALLPSAFVSHFDPPMTLAAVIGRRLRRCRVDTGLTIARLAKDLEVSETQIWRWESGFSCPGSESLFMLSAGIPALDLHLTLSEAAAPALPELPERADPTRTLRQEFGYRMELLRRAAGLSRSDVAGALDTTPSYIGKWERGEKVPNAESLVLLARTIPGFDIHYVLTGEVFSAPRHVLAA